MNMTVAFDTLDYAKKLEKAGVSLPQAEQQSRLLAEVLSKAVASPDDLAELNRSLSSKIESCALRLERKITPTDLGRDGSFDKIFLKLFGYINQIKWMLCALMAIDIAVALKVFLP